jgi:hypothetical protein
MRGENKQHAGRFVIAVQETMCRPGGSQHRMARADRHPLAAKERIELPLLDDDGHFSMGIDASWNPSIRGDRHFLDVERLAPLISAHQDASLQPRGTLCPFAQILLVDDWHLYSSQDPPVGTLSLAMPDGTNASQHLPLCPRLTDGGDRVTPDYDRCANNAARRWKNRQLWDPPSIASSTVAYLFTMS